MASRNIIKFQRNKHCMIIKIYDYFFKINENMKLTLLFIIRVISYYIMRAG